MSTGVPSSARIVTDAGDKAFTYPFEYWVGMDTDPRTTPEALAEFNRFYSATHVGEVIAAHPGFVSASRYELIERYRMDDAEYAVVGLGGMMETAMASVDWMTLGRGCASFCF